MGTGCSKNGEKLPFSFIGLLPIGGVGRKSPTRFYNLTTLLR